MTERHGTRRREVRELTVLYDEQCPLCRRTAARLQSIRTSARIVAVPLQEANVSQLLPGAHLEDLLAELHVIDRDGRVYRGADAVLAVLEQARGIGPWLAAVRRLPGFRSLSAKVYRLIARNRYRWFGRSDSCESGSCELHLRGGQRDASGHGERGGSPPSATFVGVPSLTERTDTKEGGMTS